MMTCEMPYSFTAVSRCPLQRQNREVRGRIVAVQRVIVQERNGPLSEFGLGQEGRGGEPSALPAPTTRVGREASP